MNTHHFYYIGRKSPIKSCNFPFIFFFNVKV